ncbi:hypothetical protein ABZP36_021734 [Zizania latifolia]
MAEAKKVLQKMRGTKDVSGDAGERAGAATETECEGRKLHVEDAKNATFTTIEEGFQVCADELGSIVERHDSKKWITHGGVTETAVKLATSPTDGFSLLINESSLTGESEPAVVNEVTVVVAAAVPEGLPLAVTLSLAIAMKKMTVAVAGVFSAVSCWYGFMFGRESARRELGGIIEDLRSGSSTATNSTASPDSDAHSKP